MLGRFKYAMYLGLLSVCVYAQTMEPRLYANAPVGLNFFIMGAGYSTGALETSPELDLTNPRLDAIGTVLAYARVFDILGKTAKFDIIVPTAHISGSAEQNGVTLKRSISGLGDVKARFSWNLLGSPALGLKEFIQYKQDSILGVSVQVTLPTGQYDSTKLINVGTNTWAVKPGIGFSQRWSKMIFEVDADAEFYSVNHDFVTGTLHRKPLYSVQAHVVYNFPKGKWMALSANHYWGSEAQINGIGKNNALANSRFSALFAFPIDKHNAIKIVGSTGVNTRIGTDFDSIGIAWQYRWGGGL